MAKETKKEGVKEVKKPKTYKFKGLVVINGEATELKGDDLKEMLLGVETPTSIKTNVHLEVTSGGKTLSKDLKVFDAKRAFTGIDNTNLDLLVINLGRTLA